MQNRVLAGLFREWDLDRPDVLAHDFGGATALRAYLQTAFYRQIAQMDQAYTEDCPEAIVAAVLERVLSAG